MKIPPALKKSYYILIFSSAGMILLILYLGFASWLGGFPNAYIIYSLLAIFIILMFYSGFLLEKRSKELAAIVEKNSKK